jgi:hypothetical protein
MYIGGINPTATYSSTSVNEKVVGLPFALGSRGLDSNGVEYVFGKSAAGVAAYAVALLDEGFDAVEASTTTSAPGAGAGKMVGIPQVAIAAGYYGWFLRNGVGKLAKGAASCVKFTQLNTTGTAGVVDDDATAGAEVIERLAFSATLTSAAATACVAAYPSVGRTL